MDTSRSAHSVACRTAIFNIFVEHDLRAVGDRLRIGDLQDQWRNTGLRRDDLTVTLNELVESGLLIGTLTASGMQYQLTAAGVAQLGETAEPLAIRQSLFRYSRRERRGPVRIERRQRN